MTTVARTRTRETNAVSVGVDIGGTFTDIVIVKEQTSQVFKVPSTPQDIGQAVVDGLTRIRDDFCMDPTGISRIVHGTTVATNALLEGKGAPTGLITNSGFEDVLEIGRQNRTTLPVPNAVYNLQLERPPQVVSRRHRLGVRGRLSHNGGELELLSEDDVRRAFRFLVAEGIRSIAVCLLYSYADPRHEHQVRELLHSELDQLPDSNNDGPLHITLSSDILPEVREYERTSTTVVSAMLKPVMHGYLTSLTSRLHDLSVTAPLEVMQSAGGIMRAEAAAERAIYTLLSGPAAGVRGAQYSVTSASEIDGQNLITLDMGGTSTDLSLVVGGEAAITVESSPGGYPVRIPMLDIHAIGQGGGSIVTVDAAGGIQVGPRSAGADPGPVCYGKGGTDPTVTDAQLVAGRLNPARPLAGEVPLDAEAARRAMEAKVAEPLGLTAAQAAQGVIEIVTANMKRAVQVISIEKGHDPRDFTLVAFGGAGPLHAVLLARAMEIPRVVVPVNSGVLSALGLLAVDLAEYHVKSLIRLLTDVSTGEICEVFAALEARAAATFARQGYSASELTHTRFLDLRYLGQSYELIVPLLQGSPAGSFSIAEVKELFHSEHKRVYGHASPTEPVQLVNVRLMTAAPVAKPTPVKRTGPSRKGTPTPAPRPVSIEGQWVDTPVFERSELPVDFALEGPGVIEEAVCTTFVPPGAQARVDAYGNLIINTGVERS